MFIEREMSRDQMAAIIWTGVTSRSEEREFLFSKEKCIFAHFDFQMAWKHLVKFYFEEEISLSKLKAKLEKLLRGLLRGLFIGYNFERGMGTKLPYSLASMYIFVLFAIRGHIGKEN